MHLKRLLDVGVQRSSTAAFPKAIHSAWVEMLSTVTTLVPPKYISRTQTLITATIPLMPGIFDFAPNSHVAEEIPPEEPEVISMNGWDFTSKPSVPYRATFKLTITGLRWIFNSAGTAYDTTTNPTMNAARLLEFYRTNRRYGTFTYNHEAYGELTCRFAQPVQLPKALPDSDGLLPPVEIHIVHHNPAY